MGNGQNVRAAGAAVVCVFQFFQQMAVVIVRNSGQDGGIDVRVRDAKRELRVVSSGRGQVLATPKLSVAALGGDGHWKKGAGGSGCERGDLCIEIRDAFEAANTRDTRVEPIEKIALLNRERETALLNVWSESIQPAYKFIKLFAL